MTSLFTSVICPAGVRVMAGGAVPAGGVHGPVLAVAMAVAGIVAAGLLVLFMANRRNRRLLMQKSEEIERQRRANDEMVQMLEQKKREVERHGNALQETTNELQWQTETALRLYDEVEQQRQEMTDSIRYAERIQAALLPETTLINEILNDYFVLYQPRDIVSGDFYWVSAKKEKTLVAVADCTGHGVPGAFMSVLGIVCLREITQDESLPVDVILNLLRDQVIDTLKQRGKDLGNKDGMDMALCVIDWGNARIEYAGANIPLVLLRSTPESQHELVELNADHMPIGIYGGGEAKPFTRHVMPIEPGDNIYMFSDGYCDQFGGPDMKKFKKKNLKKLLLDIHHMNMTDQKHILQENMKRWQGDLPQVDDILILGIKI